MEKLNAKTKEGEQLGYEDGIIYRRGNAGFYFGLSIEDMIMVLSDNKIYPKVKFDVHFELICEGLTKPVIGNTLNRAFVNLIIMLFG
jgi:hypothetical protein